MCAFPRVSDCITRLWRNARVHEFRLEMVVRVPCEPREPLGLKCSNLSVGKCTFYARPGPCSLITDH